MPAHQKEILYQTERMDFGPGMAIILRFSLDSIPKGQRIQKAELTWMCGCVAGRTKMQVHRLLADWGPGVSHQYYRQFPTKMPWSQPGGRGASDRVTKPTAQVLLVPPKENTVEVTQDVELWYTGSAPNRGWILSLENDAASHLHAVAVLAAPRLSGEVVEADDHA